MPDLDQPSVREENAARLAEELVPSPLSTSARVCFFAHFDPDTRLDDYVRHYLAELRALGFAVVLITTSGLDRDGHLAASSLCHDVIVRPNHGLDFGSWAAALDKYGDDIQGDLLLANDSVYGPLGSLGATLEPLFATEADFYGLVETWEPQPHLQSWFLLLRPHVHRSEAFRALMRMPFETMSKREIIDEGEVGLTPALTRAGFRCGAAFRPSMLGPLWRSLPFNPAQLLWRELVEGGLVPFLKVEVLRDNPMSLPDVHEWEDVVGAAAPPLVPIIRAHLRRVGGVALARQPAPRREPGPIVPDPVDHLRREGRLALAARPVAVGLNAASFWAARRRFELASLAKRVLSFAARRVRRPRM